MNCFSDEEKSLHRAIINDDAAAFYALTESNADLARLQFGRFPVESLLILYDAKKILKYFRPPEAEPVRRPEFGEDYLRFKRIAKTALRLYTDGTTLKPDEAAVLCGMNVPESSMRAEGRRLNEVYRLQNRRSLKKDKRGFYRPPVPRRPGKSERLTIAAALITAAVFIIAASGFIGWVTASYGDGSAMAPALVNTAEKLTGTISQNPEAHLKITSDFTLNLSDDYSTDFSGYIDGGGHTLIVSGNYYADPFLKAAALGRVDDLTLVYPDFHAVYSGSVRRIVLDNDVTVSASAFGHGALTSVFDGNGKTVTMTDYDGVPLFSELNARILDVTFDFGEIKASYTENGGLLAGVNNSRAENVTIVASGSMEELAPGKDVYFGGFVYENRGTLYNVTANMRMTLVSDFSVNGSRGNSYFACVAAVNAGTVSGAETSEDSFVDSTTLDVAGIVADNLADGVIEKSYNRASISTVSSSADWSPNAAGIVLNNYGTVRDSFNYGDLFAVSKAAISENAQSRPAIYLGGIAAQNSSMVLNSYNGGNISVASSGALPFAGGIAGICFASDADSVISGCISNGTVSLTSDAEAGNFLTGIGGIAGLVQPSNARTVTLSKCYVIAEFEISAPDASVGAVAGTIDARKGYCNYGFSNNPDCLYAENGASAPGAGFMLYYNSFGFLVSGKYDPGAVTAEEITQKEDYWYVG